VQYLKTLKLSLALGVALLLAVACGTSAPAAEEPVAPAAAEVSAPAAAAPAEVSAPAAAPAEVSAPAAAAPAAVAVMPTSVPEATAPSEVMADTEVNPGKVTWAVTLLGNERFDVINTAFGNLNFSTFMGSRPVAGSPEGELLPGIVTDWSLSPDGLTWTFDIRDKGVKFHDGSDMTIDDVMWTFQHSWDKGCLDSCASSARIDAARVTESIVQTGPNQIEVTHEFPNSGFIYQQMSELGRLTIIIYPERPLLYDSQQELDYDKNPIMTGQMKMIEHVFGERISLERFDDYYYHPDNGLPEDRRMKFTFLDLVAIPEEATRAAALRAGEVDVAAVSLETKEQVEAGGGRVIFGDQGTYWRVVFPYFWVDPENPFNKKEVRMAMEYAIDKELLMERLYGGPEVAVVKGFGAVTPSTIGYSPGLDPLPYDPDKARQLLADVGYPNGEGFGKLILNTWPSVDMPLLPESAQVAADFFEKELNLDVEVRVGDATALNASWAAGDLAGQMLWRDNETRVDAAGITRGEYGQEGASRRFHDDPALRERTQEALAVVDLEDREQALIELYKDLRNEHYALSIGYVNTPWGLGPRIEAWEPWPTTPTPSGQYTMTLK
jgi:peptide/nickel transport system substrate-binding protein